MNYYFIYETTNNTNGKKYIGQHTTSNIDDGYLGSGKILKQAIDKYGKDNFSRKILAYANDKDELNELEKYYIDKYNAIESNEYYNIAEGGEGGNSIAGYTEEQKNEFRRKISEGIQNMTQEHKNKWKEKNSKVNKGKKHTEEHKRKNSEAQKIAQNRPEVKQKKSEAMKGENNPNYGKTFSGEHKRKLSEARSKPVIMLDKNTNKPIVVFKSQIEASKYLDIKYGYTNINNCLTGRSRTSYGYKWKYITIIEL